MAAGPRRLLLGAQGAQQQLGVVAHLARLFAVDAGDLAQDARKARATIAGRGREIGASPERACLAVEEHGQWPPALLTKAVQGAHVDGIDVGALLAIDLDVDEQLVHDRGGGRILEALVRHDMAPMAGCVTHRQQDGFARSLGFRQRARAPRPPVDRVVLVLQEVGTDLAREPVLAHRGTFLEVACRDHSRAQSFQ